MTVFGRQPAQITSAITAGLALVSLLVPGVTPVIQGAVIALVTAVLGVVASFGLAKEGSAMVWGRLVEAVVILVVAFGAGLDVGTQATIIAAGTTIVGFFLRTQVTVAPERETVRAV